MSKALSLKLKDEVFLETEQILRRSHKPRNAYFNEAIDLYNKIWKRKILKKSLINLSFDSMDQFLDNLVDALLRLENDPDTVKSIAGFQWIVSCL